MLKLIKKIYQYFSNIFRSRLTKVQYMMAVSVIAGLASGLAAVILKTCVHYVQQWIEHIPVVRLSYLLFPAAGLLITVFIVRRFFGGRLEKGIAMVLKRIAGNASVIPLKHTYAHIVTSSVTVGFGGSVGLEAPIVATGSAVGSNVARIHDLDYRERTLLIGCGAAAGIAAVFNAPIAGVVFAIEVLLTETLVVSYFIPLITASVVGVLCSKIILNESILFNFTLKEHFNFYNVPFYVLLGILCGFVALYYARAFLRTQALIRTRFTGKYKRAGIAGLALAILYFLFPPLFGEGYESVKLIGNGEFSIVRDNTTLFSNLPNELALLIFTGFIVLLKPIAAGCTIGGGGNGGNFAPSLFTGSFLGFFIAKICNSTGWVHLPVGNFALVGMAGLLSGVMYCPLTGIFLIAEITNGYELFIPLMIVSSISFFIVKQYEPYNMETKGLASSGLIFTNQKERNILTTLKLSDTIQKSYDAIYIDQTLSDLVEVIKGSDKNIFAVIDKEQKFAGLIELNDIKESLFDPANYTLTPITSIMKQPAAILHQTDTMMQVMEKFDANKTWYLPVLAKDKTFLGFISKTKLFEKYREILASQGDLYDNA